MRPNRKIMPSRWIVTDPDRNIAMQFDQKILGKLTNPIYKCALAFLNGDRPNPGASAAAGRLPIRPADPLYRSTIGTKPP